MYQDSKMRNIAVISLYGYALFFAVSVAISNVFLVLAAIFSLIYYIKNQPKLFIPYHYLRALGIFFAVMLILACFSYPFDLSIERYIKTLLRLTIFLAVVISVRQAKEISGIFFFMLLSIIMLDGYALFQWSGGNERAAGFFSHPMYLAGLAVQFIPGLFLLSCYMKNKIRYFIVFILLLSCLAVLGNGTRGAWLALSAVLPLIFIIYFGDRSKAYSGRLLVIFVIAIGIFTVNPNLQDRLDTLFNPSYQSNSERLLLWESSWHMFKDHPFTGVGYGNFEYYYQNFYISDLAKEPNLGHAHNNIINTLAETGAIGTAALLYLWGSFIYYSYRDWKLTNNIMAVIFCGAALGVFMQGFTETNFGNSIIMNYFYCLFGLYIVKMRNAKN